MTLTFKELGKAENPKCAPQAPLGAVSSSSILPVPSTGQCVAKAACLLSTRARWSSGLPPPSLRAGLLRQGQHLLEGVHGLLALAEVLEEQLQGPGDQRRVVMHGEVDEHPQEHATALVVHLQHAACLPVAPGMGRVGAHSAVRGASTLPATHSADVVPSIIFAKNVDISSPVYKTLP